MSFKVVINGAFGKMGQEACVAIENDERFELLAALGRNDNLSEVLQTLKPDIAIDLTRADVAYRNARTIIESGIRPVIGTSGLSAQEIKTLQSLAESQQLGGIIAPNFSIAAVLMMQCAQKIAAFMSAVEIIEMHHPQKQDAPSQTAIKTAQLIADSQKVRYQTPIEYHESVSGALGGKVANIPIHSLRIPGVVAEQTVIFGQSGETLTLNHKSLDRKSFMPGLIFACIEVMKQQTLIYGLEHILK